MLNDTGCTLKSMTPVQTIPKPMAFAQTLVMKVDMVVSKKLLCREFEQSEIILAVMESDRSNVVARRLYIRVHVANADTLVAHGHFDP